MVLFLHNTSKVEGEPYPNLLKEKGGRGFPTLVFMDATGEVLHQQAWTKRSVAAFHKSHRALDTLARLAGKAEQGDESVKKAIFFAKLELDRYGFKEAKAKMENLSFSGEQETSLQTALVQLEFDEAYKSAGADRKALTKKILEMHKAGRIPQGRHSVRTFWNTLLSHAQAEKDVKLYEEALPKYKVAVHKSSIAWRSSSVPDKPLPKYKAADYKRAFRYEDAVLEALKAGKEPPDRQTFKGTGGGRGARVIRR